MTDFWTSCIKAKQKGRLLTPWLEKGKSFSCPQEEKIPEASKKYEQRLIAESPAFAELAT